MSHFSIHELADRVISEVDDMTSKEVSQALFDRKIVLHYSESARDILIDKIFSEKMEESPY